MKTLAIGLVIAAISGTILCVFIVGIAAYQLNYRTPPMVDFDFKGLRIGDPAPAWLKVETPKDDYVQHPVDGTKWTAWFSVLDGNVEAITINFDDVYEAIEAYETKFGVAGLRLGKDVVWMTKEGKFVISKEYKHGSISSEKYIANAVESVKQKNKELSSKL